MIKIYTTLSKNINIKEELEQICDILSYKLNYTACDLHDIYITLKNNQIEINKNALEIITILIPIFIVNKRNNDYITSELFIEFYKKYYNDHITNIVLFENIVKILLYSNDDFEEISD